MIFPMSKKSDILGSANDQLKEEASRIMQIINDANNRHKTHRGSWICLSDLRYSQDFQDILAKEFKKLKALVKKKGAIIECVWENDPENSHLGRFVAKYV